MKISLDMPKDLALQLRIQAAKMDISREEFLRQAATEWLARIPEKERKALTQTAQNTKS